jgi:hypothetical protein
MAAWDELRRCRPAAFALVASEYADAALACGRAPAAHAALTEAAHSEPGIDVLRALARLDPTDAHRTAAPAGPPAAAAHLSAALDLLAAGPRRWTDALQALREAVSAAAKPCSATAARPAASRPSTGSGNARAA